MAVRVGDDVPLMISGLVWRPTGRVPSVDGSRMGGGP
jgi:hypothetical protein